MIQQHPYCRTCGSMVRSKTVCKYCGCDPMKGHDYCCDCGTSTIAEAIMCVHCGATFQRRFPVTLAVLISVVVIVGFAAAGYYMTQRGKEPSEKISETNDKVSNTDSATDMEKVVPVTKNESGKVIVNDPSNLLKHNNAISRLINNLPAIPNPEPEKKINPSVAEVRKEEVVTPPEKITPQPGRTSMNVFSYREMRNYSVGCTYYTGKSKNNVVFFTTNVYGYVKINGKVFALQGVQKGNDIARFAGAGYEVSIEILGLAGNENEWVAEATLIVKDVRQRTLSTHKVYSACTDF